MAPQVPPASITSPRPLKRGGSTPPTPHMQKPTCAAILESQERPHENKSESAFKSPAQEVQCAARPPYLRGWMPHKESAQPSILRQSPPFEVTISVERLEGGVVVVDISTI